MKNEKNHSLETLKKINHFVFSRTFLILALLFFQLYVLFKLFDKMHSGLLSYGTTTLLTFITYIIIINRREKPSYKQAFMLPIMLFPVFGILLYIFLEFQLGPRLVNKRLDFLDLNVIGYEKQNPLFLWNTLPFLRG